MANYANNYSQLKEFGPEQITAGENTGHRGEEDKVILDTEPKPNVSESTSRSDAPFCRKRSASDGAPSRLSSEFLGRWSERGVEMGSNHIFMHGAAFYDDDDEEYMKPDEAFTRVGLSYQIVKFYNIDVRSESFVVNFELTMQYKIKESDREYYQEWRNGQYGKTFQELFDSADIMHKDMERKEKEKEKEKETRVVERMKTKPPILEVRNAIETREIICERVTGTTWMQDRNSWDWWVQLYGQYSARCHESLELERFPFTRQAFSVVLVAKQSSNNMVLVPFNCPHSRPYFSSNKDYTKTSKTFFRSNSMKQSEKRIGAWEIESHHLAIIPSELTPQMPSGFRYCRALLVLQARQIPSNIMLNVFLLIFFLTLCGIMGVHIKLDSEEVTEVVSLEMTVLLTMVAYKVSINEMLPDKPYLTWIDMYLVVAFFLVFSAYSLLIIASYKEHWNLQYIDFNWWHTTIAFNLGSVWVWAHLPLLGLSIESYVPSTQRLFYKAVLYVLLMLLAAICYLLVLLLHLACLSLPDSRFLDITAIAHGRWFHELLFPTWRQCMEEENKQFEKVRDSVQAMNDRFQKIDLTFEVKELELIRPLADTTNEVPDYYAVQTQPSIGCTSPKENKKGGDGQRISILSKEMELEEKPPFLATRSKTAPPAHASHNSPDSFSNHQSNTPVQVLCYYGGLVASMTALIKLNDKEQWEQHHSVAGTYWRDPQNVDKVPNEITFTSIGVQVLGMLSEWLTFTDSCEGIAHIVQFLKTCQHVHKVPKEDFNIVALVTKEIEQLAPASVEEVQQQILRLKDQHVATINCILAK